MHLYRKDCGLSDDELREFYRVGSFEEMCSWLTEHWGELLVTDREWMTGYRPVITMNAGDFKKEILAPKLSVSVVICRDAWLTAFHITTRPMEKRIVYRALRAVGIQMERTGHFNQSPNNRHHLYGYVRASLFQNLRMARILQELDPT